MTYTASQARPGAGTTLSIGSTTPVLIGEVVNLPPELPDWLTEDVSNLQSPASEHIATFLENKELTFEVNRVASDAGQEALMAAYQSGQAVAFKLQLPKSGSQATAGDSWAFNAIVVNPGKLTIDPKKAVKASIKLQPTGTWTATAGS